MNVGFDHADEACFDFLRGSFGVVPQIAIEAIFARRKHGKLWAALATVLEECHRIEHAEPEFGRKRIGERLAGPQWRTIAGDEDADFVRRDTDFCRTGVDRIDDIDQPPEVKARRENFGLRAVLTIDGHNFPLAQRTATIDTEQLS